MSIKYYGIFIAYAPTVDLRHEGLGRYLAEFLKGAAKRDDVRFIVVCPSWTRDGLQDLFDSEKVPAERVEVRSPLKKPLVLRLYEAYQKYTSRQRFSLRTWFFKKLTSVRDLSMSHLERRLAEAYSVFSLVPLLFIVIIGGIFLLALSPLAIVGSAAYRVWEFIHKIFARVISPVHTYKAQLMRAILRPQDDPLVLRLFRRMEEAESSRLLTLIAGMKQIRAWYSPTAFWPVFNRIQAPRLMCVPDVVLADFPVGFSGIGGDRVLENFEAVESAIRAGQHFVTYSEAVKWDTLVTRYAIQAEKIAVVRHAANDLSRWLQVSGFEDVAESRRQYAKWLFSSALKKAVDSNYALQFLNRSVKYLFFASQFRPNKNVLTLLVAYEYLLRKRLIGHKLILTGKPAALPEVKRFVAENFLENDVLFLHGLSVPELAACYSLADLAVSPSLSEGGCPFTFTEALSVDTPVVMARIPVTEEVLTDPILREATLFDPYNWKDIAERIEWALKNRSQLLSIQKASYAALAARGWADVVNEHVDILEKVASSVVDSADSRTPLV